VVHESTVPAWRRETPGENRVAAALAILLAILLQAVLPDRLAIRPVWVLPVLEVGVLIGLTVVNPVRMSRAHPVARAGGLGLVGLIIAANVASSIRLVHAILDGRASTDPNQLLGSGAAIYLTNIMGFALLYWELDRGGPVARAGAHDPYPDFLFPQMTEREVAPPEWEPTFVDYLYVSFTNATAFSPTDTLPLTVWAKLLMALQSAVAVGVVALVIARAVNILG
jgi:hypothetical protein